MLKQLLPANKTAWEGAFAETFDTLPSLADAITSIRGTKLLSPPPSFLPFLIYEYGLGELRPYVPNLYDLIAEGIDWQRVRGTPRSIEMGLEWLTYAFDTLEEESAKRRFWNIFHLELDRVRDAFEDLDRIAGIVQLSVPKRSRFFRGYHGFDIRPLTYSEKSWSETHWGDYSGVRTRPDGPKWSFGRTYEFDHDLSQSELETLGAWLPPTDEEDLGWGDFAWDETEATWVSEAQEARSQAMASSVFGRNPYLEIRDGSGEPIGYRRARVERYAAIADAGPYTLSGTNLVPQANIGTLIYLEFQTGFGEGNTEQAASAAVVFDGAPIDDDKPGKAWLEPGEIEGQSEPIAVQPFPVLLGESIRERVKVLLRFTGALDESRPRFDFSLPLNSQYAPLL